MDLYLPSMSIGLELIIQNSNPWQVVPLRSFAEFTLSKTKGSG